MSVAIPFPSEIFENVWPLSNVKFGEILQQTGGRLSCELFAEEGTFVFKIANPERAEDNIIRDTFAFNFLKARNFRHIPALLKTRSGENYQNIDGKFVFVMEHIEGSKEGRSPEKWAQLAEIAAELHDITNYPYDSDITIQFELAHLEERAKNLPFGKEIMEVVDQLPNFDGLSQSVIHTDLGLDNAIRRPDNSMVLIDWDDAGLSTTILDLGYPLHYYFADLEDFVTEDGELIWLPELRDRATAFYKAYFSKRTLPDRDRNLIFDAGLVLLLDGYTYGNSEEKWQHIKFVLKYRDIISAVVNDT